VTQVSSSDSTGGWEALFWTVFERSRNAMALFDEERRYVEVNPIHVEIFGRRREELLGRRVDDFLPDEELPTVEEEWREFLRTGEVAGERSYTSADGTVVRVEYAAITETITGRRLVLAVSATAAPDEPRVEPAAIDVSEGLSPREQEVVRLVAMGMTSREAADELSVSTETVRTHIRNALAKTGTRTRAQLVARVLGNGRLDEPRG
jgi:PAS domain S-box-containing protein